MIDIVIGMVAAPRDIGLITAVDNLRAGGFQQHVCVCTEPTSELADIANTTIHINTYVYGGYMNYLQTAYRTLLCRDAPYVLIVEDDVEYCAGAHTNLQAGIAENPQAALFNLYLPRRYSSQYPQLPHGWFTHNLGRQTFGLLACCYRRDALISFLSRPELAIEAQARPPKYDWRVYMHFLVQRQLCLGHYPSLVNHIGTNSILGHKDGPHRKGWAFAKDYV